jgi:hypothetical protein
MSKIKHYAIFNYRADLGNGNAGFCNTWSVDVFHSREERDAFVAHEGNRRARAVTRVGAEEVWRRGFLENGEPIPRGGFRGFLERIA